MSKKEEVKEYTISNAKDIVESNSTFLLYGKSGVGKTYTTNFLDGKTLYISIDKSEFPLKGNKNIDIVDFDTHNAWTDWNHLMKFLQRTDLTPYKNIVFDNVSELFRAMLGHMGRVGKNNRVPTMMNYQQIDFFIIDSLRYINSLEKRIVYYAWETTDEFQTEGGQIYNRSLPDLRDKILNNFMGLCQVVGKLVTNEKTGNRGYMLAPTNALFAKNQLSSDKFALQEDIFKLGTEEIKEVEDDGV